MAVIASDLVVHLFPQSFDGVVIGGVRRQEEELQAPLLGGHVIFHHFRLVDLMAIDNKKHRALGVMHQPLEELQEGLRRGTAFVDH